MTQSVKNIWSPSTVSRTHITEPGVVVHICNPSVLLVTCETETGELLGSSQARGPGDQRMSVERELLVGRWKDLSLQSCSLNSIRVPWHVCTCVCTHRHRSTHTTPQNDICVPTYLSLSICLYLTINTYTTNKYK